MWKMDPGLPTHPPGVQEKMVPCFKYTMMLDAYLVDLSALKEVKLTSSKTYKSE